MNLARKMKSSCIRVCPRLPTSGHRDETDQNRLLVDVGSMLSEQVKLLIARSTDRDDHPAAVLQLVDQRLGNMVRGTRHDDRVEWRMLRPALVPIAGEHFHVKKSKPSEICLGSFGERFNDLDRIDFSYKPRKNSGLVPIRCQSRGCDRLVWGSVARS